MARPKTSLTSSKPLAGPSGSSLSQVEEPSSGFDRVLDEAKRAKSNDAATPAKKAQRSREGMVSTNLWMNPKARKQLKLYAYGMDEGLEEFILKALNARLEAEGQKFRIA